MELHMDPHLYYGAWNLLAYQSGWATRVGLNTVGTYPLASCSAGYVLSPQRVWGTMEQALLQPLMAMCFCRVNYSLWGWLLIRL